MKSLRLLCAAVALCLSGAATAQYGCESGHWIESVFDDGEFVKLEDGSLWRVSIVGRIDSMLWLPTNDIVVCPGKLINVDDNEAVDSVRIR